MIKITRSSGRDFPEHQPIRLEYYFGLGLKTDYMLYEVDLYEDFDVGTDELLSIEVQPPNAESFKFNGYLYSIMTLSKRQHVQIHFVSKYYPALMAVVPLFGKGNVVEIASSMYRQCGVPTVVSDSAQNSLDSVIFPRTARRCEAIQYLMNRTQTALGYMSSTVIGNTAYLLNVTEGRVDIPDLPYEVLAIRDDRKAVDVAGGLSIQGLSDSADVDSFMSKQRGSSLVTVATFGSIDSETTYSAFVRNKQARAYYSGYTAQIQVQYWLMLFGSNIAVTAKQDVHRAVPFQYLDKGSYYVNSQILVAEFTTGRVYTKCGIQLVG